MEAARARFSALVAAQKTAAPPGRGKADHCYMAFLQSFLGIGVSVKRVISSNIRIRRPHVGRHDRLAAACEGRGSASEGQHSLHNRHSRQDLERLQWVASGHQDNLVLS